MYHPTFYHYRVNNPARQVMLARAPHVAYTVFLCVFGSLGFLPMAALRARMGQRWPSTLATRSPSSTRSSTGASASSGLTCDQLCFTRTHLVLSSQSTFIQYGPLPRWGSRVFWHPLYAEVKMLAICCTQPVYDGYGMTKLQCQPDEMHRERIHRVLASLFWYMIRS